TNAAYLPDSHRVIEGRPTRRAAPPARLPPPKGLPTPWRGGRQREHPPVLADPHAIADDYRRRPTHRAVLPLRARGAARGHPRNTHRRLPNSPVLRPQRRAPASAGQVPAWSRIPPHRGCPLPGVAPHPRPIPRVDTAPDRETFVPWG